MTKNSGRGLKKRELDYIHEVIILNDDGAHYMMDPLWRLRTRLAPSSMREDLLKHLVQEKGEREREGEKERGGKGEEGVVPWVYLSY